MVRSQEEDGKLNQLPVEAAACSSHISRRLFIHDRELNMWFLIDTGADVSIIPARTEDQVQLSDFKLYAANQSVIDTYGERTLQVNLGLRRACPWRFIVADVRYAIIGADFLTHYELLPDLKNGRLVDGRTMLSTVGSYRDVEYYTVSSVDNSPFSRLLADFPGITRPTLRERKVTHNVRHVIETTGRPIRARARRLPPDELKFARAVFEDLMHQGIIRPSKSEWASPIHLAPQKSTEPWRICGDYRALNRVTKPDRYPVPNIMDFNVRLKGSRVFTTIDVKRA